LAAITPSSRVQVPSGLAAADQNSDRSAFGISETKPSACAQVKAGASNMTTTSTNIGLFLQSGLAKVSDQHVIQRCVGFYHCLELPLPLFRRMLAFGAVRQIRTGRCGSIPLRGIISDGTVIVVQHAVHALASLDHACFSNQKDYGQATRRQVHRPLAVCSRYIVKKTWT
jgi:hypothetical protein